MDWIDFPVIGTQNLKGEEEEDFSALPSLTRVSAPT